jgi:SH3 domain protein
LRKIYFTFVSVLVLLVISGCRSVSPQSPTQFPFPTAETAAVLPSSTAQALETQAALPSPTPQSSVAATSTPFLPLKGTITVDNFKLRSGPGFLFDTVSLYKLNETVTVYGKSQGAAWYFVAASDSRSGWMKADYITLAGDAADLPVIGYKNADVISGHVRNSHGDPMTGVGVIIFSANNQNTADNTVTDSSGTYYLFLPQDVTGNFTVGINAYSCTSNAVDAQCQFLYGYPSAQSVSIPQPAPISVEFVLPDL